MTDFEPTVESARLADEQGAMREWITIFLSSDKADGGNIRLLDEIKKRDYLYFGPTEYNLSDLQPVLGPSPDFKYSENSDKWERRVSAMKDGLEGGWHPAPLIATDYWESDFEISDGCHRQEALLRSGISTYAVIFFCRDKASRDRLIKASQK